LRRGNQERKSMEQKAGSLKISIKLIKTLASLRKREKTEINKNRYERRNITTDTT